MSVEPVAFGGKHTPEHILYHALNEKDDITTLVIILEKGEDKISIGWSDGVLLKRLGMCEAAKIEMLKAAGALEDPNDGR